MASLIYAFENETGLSALDLFTSLVGVGRKIATKHGHENFLDHMKEKIAKLSGAEYHFHSAAFSYCMMKIILKKNADGDVFRSMDEDARLSQDLMKEVLVSLRAWKDMAPSEDIEKYLRKF